MESRNQLRCSLSWKIATRSDGVQQIYSPSSWSSYVIDSYTNWASFDSRSAKASSLLPLDFQPWVGLESLASHWRKKMVSPKAEVVPFTHVSVARFLNRFRISRASVCEISLGSGKLSPRTLCTCHVFSTSGDDADDIRCIGWPPICFEDLFSSIKDLISVTLSHGSPRRFCGPFKHTYTLCACRWLP